MSLPSILRTNSKSSLRKSSFSQLSGTEVVTAVSWQMQMLQRVPISFANASDDGIPKVCAHQNKALVLVAKELSVELTNMFLPSGRLLEPHCFMQECFRPNEFLETIAIAQSLARLLEITMISTQTNVTLSITTTDNKSL